MKKFLLAAGCFVAMASAASATDYVISKVDMTTFTTSKYTLDNGKEVDQLTGVFTADDGTKFDVTLKQNTANNDASVIAAQNSQCRWYKDYILIIKAPESVGKIKEIVFTTAQGKIDTFTATSGDVTVDKANNQITWTDANGVNPFEATASASQIRFSALTISNEAGAAPVVKNTLFSETFMGSLGDFTTENTILPEDLTFVWSATQSYGAKASGYANSTNYASEAWLISPVIDLTKNTEVEMSFEQAVNFFTDVETAKTEATVWVRTEGGQWAQLNPAYPESLSWNFASSGAIDLSAYDGKKIQIGFKYTSTDAKAGTWEVKNLLVSGFGDSTVPDVPVVEKKDFTKVTAITTGKSYVLTVGNQLCTAIPATVNYGRLALVDAEISGDVVKSEEANAIVINGEAGKYTLTDASGRFLGGDETHLSTFQIYTELNEGCYWTITFNADGTVKIVNNLNGTTVSQSKGTNGFYSNCAPANLSEVAEGDYNLPTLYMEGQTAISDVEADVNAPVEYYNLQGVRVANPANGLFIMRQGSKAVKVIR